jgi:hypothetical protein
MSQGNELMTRVEEKDMKRSILACTVAALPALLFAQTTPNPITGWAVQSTIIPGNATQMAGAAVVGNYLYILGGNNNVDGDTGRVYRFTVDAATGGLSNVTAMTTLPTMNNFAYISEQVDATSDGIYIAGGGFNTTGPNRNNVTSIGVDPSGNFTSGAWKQSAAFPNGYDPELGVAVIPANGYLYAMGGDSTSQTPPVYDLCYYAQTQADGGLASSFSTGATLPNPSYFGAAAAIGNNIILHIGCTTKTNSTATDAVYVNTVNADGTMGTWVLQSGATLPQKVYGAAMVAVGDTVFMLGGRVIGGAATLSTVWRATMTGSTLGAWQTSADAQLPDGVRYHAAVYSPVSKSIYVVSIRRASDGTISNEAYISAPLFPRSVSAAVATDAWTLYE